MTTPRLDKPKQSDEVTTALAFLDFQRATVLAKAEGLDAAALAQSLPPSSMTLGGLLKHLAYVEHWWTREVFLGLPGQEPWASVDWSADEDWDWHSAAEDDPAALRALLGASIAASDVVLSAGSFDDLSVGLSRTGEQFSLRWVVLHLIEEYARHAGHADLLREGVDGSTGE
ncbi:MAG: DinB family protein [Ornithinibacter sp.]